MILDSFKLEGKIALITGAGRGLGRAMAVKFAEVGADIVAASRTRSQLEETAEAVGKTGRKCLIVPTDVTRSDQVNAMAEAALKEFGRIDILVNNAGGGDESASKRIDQITDNEWRRGLDTNLTSQFYAARAVVPAMVKQNRGKIINVASGFGLRGGRDNYMYACSKGGVIQLTRSLALTYAKNNVQTNCIVPGVFPHDERAMEFYKGGKFIPLGRTGNDAELAPLAVFLASDASNHINGELVIIDGGGLAGGISPTGVLPELAGKNDAQS
ncbi:MAG TPA: SDR family NAD(P)-dependent oxidoreductase [Candidatus Binataceae bacterium]|nr:SDR family NAD(P)-dependent oxidoreductase [Candidatus Binataceae bacterium]